MATEVDRRVKIYAAGQDAILPAFETGNIPVFLGCDDVFFPHAMAVVASMLESASPDNRYDLFIVQDGVSERKLGAALEWMARFPNASLRFVDIGNIVDAIGRKKFPVTRHVNFATYFRIFAPTIFANYDKIVYHDSDIAVLSDVAGFYHQDLEGCLLGACHDFVTERQSLLNPDVARFWREELGKEPGESYFFAGGVVMDLGQMRREATETALLEKMRSIKNSNLLDQDIMNAVLNGRVKYLDSAWNFLDWMTDPGEESLNFGRVDAESLALIREARRGYKVLHFAEKKPWSAGYLGKNEEIYWRYAAMTPFYEETRAAFRAECTPWKTVPRYLAALWQVANFRLRLRFASGGGKAKYEGRLHNLALGNRRLLDLMRRFGPLGHADAKNERNDNGRHPA